MATPAATSLITVSNGLRALNDYSPFPTTALPPDVEGAHGDVSQI